jgi:hypothetical protein
MQLLVSDLSLFFLFIIAKYSGSPPSGKIRKLLLKFLEFCRMAALIGRRKTNKKKRKAISARARHRLLNKRREVGR